MITSMCVDCGQTDSMLNQSPDNKLRCDGCNDDYLKTKLKTNPRAEALGIGGNYTNEK